MTIDITANGNDLTVTLAGRMDTVTAPQLEEELKKYLDNAKTITFDFAQLEYVSSAGLSVLMMAQDAMDDAQGTMLLRNVNECIMDVFDVTGLSDILTIEQ